MQNINSYGKPKDFKDTWNVVHKDKYFFRNTGRIDLPLVKSIRLSYLPKFKFAEVFNNLPGDFKWIMERKDFLIELEDFYHKRYKNENCLKRNCKFCSYESWEKHRLSYITLPKAFHYVRYGYEF